MSSCGREVTEIRVVHRVDRREIGVELFERAVVREPLLFQRLDVGHARGCDRGGRPARDWRGSAAAAQPSRDRRRPPRASGPRSTRGRRARNEAGSPVTTTSAVAQRFRDLVEHLDPVFGRDAQRAQLAPGIGPRLAAEQLGRASAHVRFAFFELGPRRHVGNLEHLVELRSRFLELGFRAPALRGVGRRGPLVDGEEKRGVRIEPGVGEGHELGGHRVLVVGDRAGTVPALGREQLGLGLDHRPMARFDLHPRFVGHAFGGLGDDRRAACRRGARSRRRRPKAPARPRRAGARARRAPPTPPRGARLRVAGRPGASRAPRAAPAAARATAPDRRGRHRRARGLGLAARARRRPARAGPSRPVRAAATPPAPARGAAPPPTGRLRARSSAASMRYRSRRCDACVGGELVAAAGAARPPLRPQQALVDHPRLRPARASASASVCTDTSSPSTSTEPSASGGRGPTTIDAIQCAAALRSRLSARIPASCPPRWSSRPGATRTSTRRSRVGVSAERSVGMHGPIEPRDDQPGRLVTTVPVGCRTVGGRGVNWTLRLAAASGQASVKVEGPAYPVRQ